MRNQNNGNATGAAKMATSKTIEINFCETNRLELSLVNGKGEKRLAISFRNEIGGKQADISVLNASGETVAHFAAFKLDGCSD